MRYSDITVSVLAGGHSRRFGRDKGLVELKGRTLLRRAIDLGLRLTDEVLISVGAEDPYPVDKVNHHMPDINDDRGPAGGIHAILNASLRPFVLFLPVDVPLLRFEVLMLLYKRRRKEGPLVIRSAAGLENLICLWPRRSADCLEAGVRSGQLKVQVLAERCGVEVVDLREIAPHIPAEEFMNVNTPDDLERVKAYMREHNID